MFVSQWITEEGVPITPPQFTSWLACTANAMYAKGWDVIGSFCKTPNLRPWKMSSRQQLALWAQDDIAAGRSNSLNLRLQGTGVIALDCDFHDASLMDKFVTDLSRMLGIRRQYLFTCKGAKGGKIFFRYSSRGVTDTPPKRLGPVAFTAGWAGIAAAKQELEIKTDLSTVAGLYGKVMLTNTSGEQYPDAIVYSSYDGCRSILEAAPKDLQTLTKRDLEAIEDLYISILQQGHFVSAEGHEISAAHYEIATLAAVAAYVVRIGLKQQNGFDYARFLSDVSTDETFTTQVAPFYSFLNLGASVQMIERMFRGGPMLNEKLEAQSKQVLDALKAKDFRYLLNLSASFGMLTKRATERIKQEAQAKGLIHESMTLPPMELFSLLKQTSGGN